MSEEIATPVETKHQPEASKRTWLCVWGFHSWGKYETRILTEEVKGLYKKSIPVRTVACGRCALIMVKSLV